MLPGRATMFSLSALLVFLAQDMAAQEIVTYKTIDSVTLDLEILRPPADLHAEISHPAIVFFFGGGWKGGNRQHFIAQAKYFAQRGLVCFLADYRTASKHNTSPFRSLEDAKSAMRYIRKNASNLRIDPQKIIASGGSAGGHLAAATALTTGHNAPGDDLSVSCWPNALILFNPVIDNGPAGYGYERIGDAYPSFSPLHNIRAGAPPTLFLLGTNDHLIPVETAEYFKMAMEKVGSRCDLKLYDDGKHGFFNYRNFENYKATVLAADHFLQSLGYLDSVPEVVID